MATNRKNLAAGILANSPGTSGTSFVLETGYGATMPAVPFHMTTTPPGQLSTLGNSEIVNVTARSGDTLTVTRAQRGTTAKNVQAGWPVANGVYVEDEIGSENIANGAVTLAKLASSLLSSIYPVGSIYTNATNSTNPATLLGFGVWSIWGSGRVAVGVDTGQTEFNTPEKTGGANTHTLTEAQMPSHTHQSSSGANFITDLGAGTAMAVASGGAFGFRTHSNATASAGSGSAHNNLQPYITCYMWKRVS